MILRPLGPDLAFAMDQRHRYTSGRRSPTLQNPARATMPTMPSSGAGYNSLYGGDIHVIPTARYDSPMTPRGQTADYRPPATTTTTTYAVKKDPISRSSSLRESSRSHRSSTIDSVQKRPPVIVTTTTTRPHGSSSHASSGSARPSSPARETYRTSDEGQYYAQPASSIRSRSHNRNSYSGQPFSATFDSDEYARLRERHEGLMTPRPDAYARPRPTSVYNNFPRHSTHGDGYGDAGYEHIKPGDLTRYDLEHPDRPSRRRRDSFDQNYYRPTVNVTTDMPRYEAARRGPPPTSRGLEKFNRTAAGGIYDAPTVRMPVPPAVPLPPPDPRRSSGLLEAPGSPTERRGSTRERPVSLYQERDVRPSHDDFYRTRDDDLVQRELRDRELNRDREYFDEAVGSRGFGLRIEGKEPGEPHRNEPDARAYDDRRDRRERDRDRDRRDYDERAPKEPKRRSDEELGRAKDDRRELDDRDRKAGRESSRRDDELRVKDSRREPDDRDRKLSRDTGRRDDELRDRTTRDTDTVRGDDEDREPKKIRDKVVAGLGLAAGAIGLGPAMKAKDEKADRDENVSPRRRLDEPRRGNSDELDVVEPRRAERSKYRVKDPEDRRPSAREELEILEPPRERAPRRERVDLEDLDSRDRNRRDAEARLAGEAVDKDGSSSSEEGKPRTRPRRQRPSSVFRPTNTEDLKELKAQMAAMEEKEKSRDIEKPSIRDSSPRRRSPPSPSKRESIIESDSKGPIDRDESRGRELVPAAEEKQVRVVSPPRDKDEKKPIKGILKQPKSKFPEEPNPVREGVAPHKDDKTKADVPPGARWTKINRKLVNPEALTIGKERFEVRDDFVIVLRVLSKEEIEAYTAATAQLREMRRKESEKDGKGKDEEQDYDRGDDDRKRRHHQRKHRDNEDDTREKDRDRDRDRDRERERDRDRERERERDRDRDRDYRDREKERPRRHRRYSDEDEEVDSRTPRAIEYHDHDHHRSNRHREREAIMSE